MQFSDLATILAIVVLPTPLIPVNKYALGILSNFIELVIVSEIMSSNFRWVEPETEIEDAIQKMLNNNVRRLVILDNNKLAGVITQTDLTGFLRDKLLVDKTIKNI